jgi:hypothetical protein
VSRLFVRLQGGVNASCRTRGTSAGAGGVGGDWGGALGVVHLCGE